MHNVALALKEFFEHLPNLLSGSTALFSFFNGLGATSKCFVRSTRRRISTRVINADPTIYDVYTQVAELHLQEIGLQTKWFDVEVGPSVQARWGETREYFTLPIYRLPICSLDF